MANKLSPEKLYRLLGALNVKYIVSLRWLPPGDISLIQHFPEHPSWLYRLNRPVPRAFIIARTVVEEDPSRILNRLSSADFDPLEEVILEQPFPIPANGDFHSQAEIIRYTNQSVTVKASLNGAGILVQVR